MIEVEKLSRTFGDRPVVREISFQVKPGRVTGFLGPNGAGKTTTLRMLATSLPPSSGTARVAGFDIQKDGDLIRKNIGYLPEQPPLYPEMTVLEYLRFAGSLHGLSGESLDEAIEESGESCGLFDVFKKLCRTLSRGYRQRVGLARALIHDPPVLILDEPTAGLDPAQIIQIRDLISELASEKTVLLSTHILAEVQEICGAVLILHDGEIALSADMNSLPQERSLEEQFLQCISGGMLS